MDKGTAILAAVPPLLAMFAEWQNPVTREMLLREAESAIGNSGLVAAPDPSDQSAVQRQDEHRKAIAQVIAATAGGAVSVSGLVPTGVSVLTGAIAAVHELSASYWCTDAVFLVVVLGTICILKYMGKTSLFDIGARKTELFSIIIYGVNFALIVVICVVFLIT